MEVKLVKEGVIWPFFGVAFFVDDNEKFFTILNDEITGPRNYPSNKIDTLPTDDSPILYVKEYNIPLEVFKEKVKNLTKFNKCFHHFFYSLSRDKTDEKRIYHIAIVEELVKNKEIYDYIRAQLKDPRNSLEKFLDERLDLEIAVKLSQNYLLANTLYKEIQENCKL
jgi:hypothetical protein